MPPAVLSVTSFTVALESGVPVVRWHTASEDSATQFWVERQNGLVWDRLNLGSPIAATGGPLTGGRIRSPI